MKLRPETYAKLRAFTDALQLRIDRIVESVKPLELAKRDQFVDDHQDLLEGDSHEGI